MHQAGTNRHDQVYDSPEALKKFEPRYRSVRYGLATKIEKASRQQRMWRLHYRSKLTRRLTQQYRQATQEPFEGAAWYSEGQGSEEEEGKRLSDGTRFGAASFGGTHGWHVAYLHASLQRLLHIFGKAMALGCQILHGRAK